MKKWQCLETVQRDLERATVQAGRDALTKAKADHVFQATQRDSETASAPRKSLAEYVDELKKQLPQLTQDVPHRVTDPWTESFRNTSVRKRSALLIEAADCHAELLPGFVLQLRGMRYLVDVLTTSYNYHLNSLSRISDPSVRIFSGDIRYLYRFLTRDILEKYEFIVFTSRTLYYVVGCKTRPTIYEVFPILHEFRSKMFCVEHHLQSTDGKIVKAEKVGVLANPGKLAHLRGRAVNFPSFGDVLITPKNKLTTFIVVGNIDSSRKNHQLMLSSMVRLAERRVGFRLIVVARLGGLELPAALSGKASFHPDISYESLYRLVEASDFILPMLDPLNPDHHRYLRHGTSGTFQLSYGFRKPCVIHRDFAEPHGYDESNSVVYDNNKDFFDALTGAIKTPANEYRRMQDALGELASKITRNSLANFVSFVPGGGEIPVESGQ
jgi:glycosyltransferase involved in cell wall biosynthesis